MCFIDWWDQSEVVGYNFHEWVESEWIFWIYVEKISPQGHIRSVSDQSSQTVANLWAVSSHCFHCSHCFGSTLRDLFWFYWESEKIIFTLLDGSGGPVILVKDILGQNFLISMWVIIADVCGFIFSSAVNVCDKVTDYFLDRTSFPQNSHALYLSPSL